MSADQANVFENEQPNSPEADQQQENVQPEQVANPFDNILGGIKSEDGNPKYTTVESALNSIAPAQEHIARIEAENARLRQDMDKATKVDELLNKATSQNQQGATTLQSEPVTTDAIASIVKDTLTGIHQADLASQNVNTVNTSLVEAYGDVEKAKAAVEAKATQLNTTVDMIKEMSAKSPQAVLAWFNTKAETTPQTVQSGVNTEAFTQNNAVQQKPYKTVMGAASTADLVSAWKLSGERIKGDL